MTATVTKATIYMDQLQKLFGNAGNKQSIAAPIVDNDNTKTIQELYDEMLAKTLKFAYWMDDPNVPMEKKEKYLHKYKLMIDSVDLLHMSC